MRNVFNASNVLGTIAFLMLLILPAGLVEAEMYISAIACAGVGCACAYLSMKEDGEIK